HSEQHEGGKRIRHSEDRNRAEQGVEQLFHGQHSSKGRRQPQYRMDACTLVLQHDYAALRLASISLRLIRHSAIWMALSAAPLRRLSETTHMTRPFSTVASSRMRLI